MKGFAVKQDDEILIQTVGHSAVSAAVNFLLTDRNIMIHAGTPDEVVIETFHKHKGDGVELVAVIVKEDK